jgi:hypothetical protein
VTMPMCAMRLRRSLLADTFASSRSTKRTGGRRHVRERTP